MPFEKIKVLNETVYGSKEEAEKYFTSLRTSNLLTKDLGTLLWLAEVESNNFEYNLDGEEEKASFKGGQEARFHEICNVIAEKLIHASTPEERKQFNASESQEIPLIIKKQVYNIIEDKFKKSEESLKELQESYPEGKKEYNAFVRPLQGALHNAPILSLEKQVGGAKQPSMASSEAKLEGLCEYKDKLLNSEGGKPSIAQQMKESGDPMILRVLKGIVFTLFTALGYGIYAIKQAATGGAYAGIDNPAEQFMKSSGRELFSERYESIHHAAEKVKTPVEQKGVESNIEKEQDETKQSGPSSGPWTFGK